VTALSPLELATGLVFGHEPAPLPASGRAPLAEIRAALLPALERGPCLVAFSGGRDSSALLATAAALAREEGLAPPVPITVRAPGAGGTHESGWQELVVSSLGLPDWELMTVDDELDTLGPVARSVLRRHGLLWPFNAHFIRPLLDAAGGGALVTGIGGDELLLSAVCRRPAGVLMGRARPIPRDARRVALHLSPRPLRAWWHARLDLSEAFPWLTPAGVRAARTALAALEADEPRRLAARLTWARGARAMRANVAGLQGMAAAAGTLLVQPMLDERVWAAVAHGTRRGGFLNRTDGMRAIFGGLLPDELLARRGKAAFDELFFHRHSRAFARRWDGSGVPEELVDAERLRREWGKPRPGSHSFTLLQAAWLASAGERVEQAPRALGEAVPAPRAA
jgi:asparagine synthase (glutamine-hydrolysing)